MPKVALADTLQEWEGLVQFGVRPIRSGRRSRKAAARPAGVTASSTPSDR